MQFIDTHIHLQDYKTINATDIVTHARLAGCEKLICVSSEEGDWSQVADLAQRFPETVVPAFGLHPWYVLSAVEEWEDRLEDWLQRFPNALVGECGLDRVKNIDEELQKQIFVKQAALAKKLNRPLIIHEVRAQDWLAAQWSQLPTKFVIHSFNGRLEWAEQIIEHGGYLGLSSASLKNPHLPQILQSIPIERVLAETDAPAQSLKPGEEGKPWFIKEQLEILENMTGKALSSQIYNNSLEFISC